MNKTLFIKELENLIKKLKKNNKIIKNLNNIKSYKIIKCELN